MDETSVIGKVRDNPVLHRFELQTELGLAVAEYRWDDGKLAIYHTEVPRALRGRGIGEILVRGMFEHVRHRNLKVIPLCWFVREVVNSYPEYRELLVVG